MARRKRLTPPEARRLDQPGAAGHGASDAGAPAAGAVFPPALAAAPISRVTGEAAAAAALHEVAGELMAARNEGRLVLRLPLGQIAEGWLVRDRIGIDTEELESLMTSLRNHGQRTPVEVVELAADPAGGARYGLISGWRRVTALRRLQAETGDPRFASVLAVPRRPDSAGDAYVAMVEENEIRLGLSYFERARIAAKAVEAGVFPTEKIALQRLFASASRARRSKIGSFLTVYHRLGDHLRFPEALPERLGLALARALERDEVARQEGGPDHAPELAPELAPEPGPDLAHDLAGYLARGLAALDPASAEAEQRALAQWLAAEAGPSRADDATGPGTEADTGPDTGLGAAAGPLADAVPGRPATPPPARTETARTETARTETARAETGTAPPQPAAGPEVRPGIRLRVDPRGGIVLSGPAVDAGFEARLRAWLQAGP